MPRNIPATILGIMAGAAVSMSSGFLLATYVVGGITPAYAAPPRIAASDFDRPTAPPDSPWPPIDYAGPLPGSETGQP